MTSHTKTSLSIPELDQTQLDLKNLTERVVETALKHGASDAQASAGLSQSTNISVRNQVLDEIDASTGRDISLTFFLGKRTGSVSFTASDPDSIEIAVKKAKLLAEHASEDPYAGLASPEAIYQGNETCNKWHPSHETIDDLINKAKRQEAEALKHDPRLIQSEGASLSSGYNFSSVSMSNGFSAQQGASHYQYSLVLLAQEQQQTPERGYDYLSKASPLSSSELDSISEKAVQNTLQKLGAKPIPTQNAPVLFIPKTAKSILGHLMGAISGRTLYTQQSWLIDALNQSVLPNWLGVQEFPHDKQAFSPSYYDSQGLPTQSNAFITNGKLTSYSLGLYSSRKLNMPHTGNSGGVRNLRWVAPESHTHSYTQMLEQLDTGLIVTDLMGSAVSLLTGDYSRGASGAMWVEKGKIVHPVTEVTLAGKLQDMLMNIQAVGTDIDHYSNYQIGSMLIDNIQIAGS